MATDSDPLIPLRGGPPVRESLVVWMFGAWDRGMKLRIEPDGRLFVGPRARVRANDLAFVRQHRAELVAAVSYCDRMAEALL